MEHLYTAGLVVAGVINSIPLIGVLSNSQLERLYGPGIAKADPTTIVLLRHRAVLFGIVGSICFTVRTAYLFGSRA